MPEEDGAGAARDCVGERPADAAGARDDEVVERAVDAPDLGVVVGCLADVGFAVLVLTG